MRRYVQSGGINNPAITLIGALLFGFVLAKSPKLMALLTFLGIVEPEKGETVMKGGIGFGGIIGNIKQSTQKPNGLKLSSLFGAVKTITDTAATKALSTTNSQSTQNPNGFNLSSGVEAARAITSKATAFTSNVKTKTIAVSKNTVINALNALKAAFNDDKAVDQAKKTNITNCVDNLVRKITEANAPESEIVTSEDMNESVQNAVTTPAPQGETFDTMMKRVVKEKIDLLKNKLATAINTRIESFKKQYKLEDDDMKCIIDLMDDVLNDLSNKNDSLFTEIMRDPKVQGAIEDAKKVGKLLSAGVDKVKGQISQNPQAAAAVTAAKENVKAVFSNFRSPW